LKYGRHTHTFTKTVRRRHWFLSCFDCVFDAPWSFGCVVLDSKKRRAMRVVDGWVCVCESPISDARFIWIQSTKRPQQSTVRNETNLRPEGAEQPGEMCVSSFAHKLDGGRHGWCQNVRLCRLEKRARPESISRCPTLRETAKNISKSSCQASAPNGSNFY
jgi:hypothetical protein